jgi:flagellar biosynthesis/type III secretory pathway M-ring protein FliF/YscJ
VRSAAGIDERRGDRVELQAAPFAPRAFAAETPPPAEAPMQMPPPSVLAGGVAALLLVGLVAPMWVRRRYLRRLREAEERVEAIALQAAASDRRAADAAQATHALQGMYATAVGAGAGTMAGASGVAGLGGLGGLGGASAARRPAAERVADVVRRDLDSAAMVLSAWLGDGKQADDGAHGRGESSTGGPLS